MRQEPLAFLPSAGPPAPPAVWSVSGLNMAAKSLLEQRFTRVQVQGEISNLRNDRSGHRYFCLKDAQAVINVAMFRGAGSKLTFVPRDGMQVVATGQVTVYPQGGRYQLVASGLAAAGAGALQAAFEALKAKLLAEGLFARERKRTLPLLPQRVAVITSPEGAVWRDIVNVSRRRFGSPPLLLVPTRVQGPASVAEVLAALARVRAHAAALHIEVVVLARGGGSLEDMAAFNDESVARALSAMPMPTVSAIGHETDVSITDFVADVRAPTPSAAAELIFAERQALREGVQALRLRISRAVRQGLQHDRMRLRHAQASLGDGKRQLWPRAQALAEQFRALERLAHRLPQRRRAALTFYMQRLQAQAPARRLERIGGQRRGAEARIVGAVQARLHQSRARLASLAQHLDALSPLAILGRGYALVQTPAGEVVRDAAKVAPGAGLVIRLERGRLRVTADGRPDAEPGLTS